MASEGKSRRNAARAKAAAARPAPRPPARRRGSWSDLFAMDSERSARLLLIGGVLGVLVLALGFLAFGYWNSVIKPRNRTVLAADGIEVSYAAMRRRMRFELALHPEFRQSQQSITALPDSTVQTLLNELTLVSRAPSDQGIELAEGEAENGVRLKIGIGPSADQRQFADALRKALQTSGLHESEYRRMVLADTLKTKVQQKFRSEVPATSLQAKVGVIAVPTTDAANAAIARIKNGEDWAAVAKEVSSEPDAKTTGGIHDYAPQGSFSPAYDGYVFSAPLGQISEPLIYQTSSSTTYYVVRVEDRTDKPVTDAQKTTVSTKRYNDWLSDMQSMMNVFQDFDEKAKNDALLWALENTTPPKPPTPVVPAVQQTSPQPVTPSEQGTPESGSSPAPEGASSPAPEGGNPPVPNQPVAPGGNGQ